MAKNLPVSFDDDVKKRLEQMSKETKLSQSALCSLATISMLENYDQRGSFIFADLLNPQHKKPLERGRV